MTVKNIFKMLLFADLVANKLTQIALQVLKFTLLFIIKYKNSILPFNYSDK